MFSINPPDNCVLTLYFTYKENIPTVIEKQAVALLVHTHTERETMNQALE